MVRAHPDFGPFFETADTDFLNFGCGFHITSLMVLLLPTGASVQTSCSLLTKYHLSHFGQRSRLLPSTSTSSTSQHGLFIAPSTKSRPCGGFPASPLRESSPRSARLCRSCNRCRTTTDKSTCLRLDTSPCGSRRGIRGGSCAF